MKIIVIILAVLLFPVSVTTYEAPKWQPPVIKRKLPLPGKLVIETRQGIIETRYYTRVLEKENG